MLATLALLATLTLTNAPAVATMDEPSRADPNAGWNGANAIMLGVADHRLVPLQPPLPPSPLFWEASTKVQRGFMLRYTRQLYHSETHFSLYVGASTCGWWINDGPVLAVSAFAQVRGWAFHTPLVGLFLAYSIAGPSFVSMQRVNAHDLGSQFIFQDMIGLGMRIGDDPAFDLEVSAVHYSNGYVFPVNSGFDIPLMFGVASVF